MKIRAYKVVPGYTDFHIFGFICHKDDWSMLKVALDKHKEGALLSIDIKKHVNRRTKKQLGIFWLAWDYYCKKMGYFEDYERGNLYLGFKERFALKRESGMYDDKGDPIRVPIGLSEANCTDHFEALFKGLFTLMENDNVDYTEFLADWEAWKHEQKELVTEGKTD